MNLKLHFRFFFFSLSFLFKQEKSDGRKKPKKFAIDGKQLGFLLNFLGNKYYIVLTLTVDWLPATGAAGSPLSEPTNDISCWPFKSCMYFNSHPYVLKLCYIVHFHKSKQFNFLSCTIHTNKFRI